MRSVRRWGARAKKWIFALLPVCILLVVLTVVLNGLERTGEIKTERPDDAIAHAPVQLLTRIQKDGRPYLRLAGYNMLTRDFLEKKPDDVFRIFILGESFAAGTPFDLFSSNSAAEGTPARWLDVLIRWRFPESHVEVISAASGGAESSRVRAVAVQLLEEASPDLLVVATGNNEGDLTNELSEDLHKWIVYRAMKKTLLPPPPMSKRPSNMPHANEVTAVLTAFKQNLEEIVSHAAERGVPVVLCTLPVNLKFDIRTSSDTTIGLPAEFLMPDDALSVGREHQAAGRFDEALSDYSRSGNRVVVLFHIAECLEKMGRFEEAKDVYRQFLEFLPICRAGQRLNDLIREKRGTSNVEIADLESAIERISPHGITDYSLFYDSCHLRWFGYFHVAHAMLESIIRRGWQPSTWGNPKPPPTVDEALDFAGWDALPARGVSLNVQYRQFQGVSDPVDRDPRESVPLAFATPAPIPK